MKRFFYLLIFGIMFLFYGCLGEDNGGGVTSPPTITEAPDYVPSTPESISWANKVKNKTFVNAQNKEVKFDSRGVFKDYTEQDANEDEDGNKTPYILKVKWSLHLYTTTPEDRVIIEASCIITDLSNGKSDKFSEYHAYSLSSDGRTLKYYSMNNDSPDWLMAVDTYTLK